MMMDTDNTVSTKLRVAVVVVKIAKDVIDFLSE